MVVMCENVRILMSVWNFDVFLTETDKFNKKFTVCTLEIDVI